MNLSNKILTSGISYKLKTQVGRINQMFNFDKRIIEIT